MSTKYIVNNQPNQTINGNIGIGTTPSVALDVVGDMKITGIIGLSGAITYPDNTIQTTADSRPYKVYTALLTQSGTASPTAIVLENTFGFVPIWEKDTTGIYFINNTGFFNINKTSIFVTKNTNNFDIAAYTPDNNSVWIETSQITGVEPLTITAIENVLNNTTIEIRVYPPDALTLGFNNISNVPVANASSVSDWNTFFDLPTNGTPFTSVLVVGNNVNLIGGSNIDLKDNLFSNNINLISVVDNINCITTAGAACFISGTSILTLNLPSLTTAGNNCLSGCTSLQTINLPQLTTAYSGCFSGCTSLQTIDLPELISTIGVTGLGSDLFSGCTSLTTALLSKIEGIGIRFFKNCTSLTTIYLPKCVGMGQTLKSSAVFDGITGLTITLTIDAAIMTINDGNPDGDIYDLQDNNTVTIIEVS